MTVTNLAVECLDRIKKGVIQGLAYMRINDERNRLSLTNIAMMLVLYKLYMTPVLNFQDITALAIAVLGYQAKRAIGGDK